MTTRQYIGARYIPVFADPVEWTGERAYEALTMVQHVGETYMSRQAVPIGAQLPDTEHGEESTVYWVHMSNWNAQVESYRQEVLQYNGRISTLEDDLPIADFDSTNTVKAAINATNALLPATDFDSTNTVKAAIDAINGILPASSFDSTNTVEKRIENLFLNPDDFNGATDAAKIQACVDYAKANGYDNILINRKYDITGSTINIALPETIPYRRLFRFVGANNGEIYKGDSSGYMFDNDSGALSHGLCLMNLRISGNKDNVTTSRASVINGRNIIRTLLFNCYITSVKNVFDGNDVNGLTIMQSHQSLCNTYINCHAAMETITTITDCKFVNDTCEEQGDYFLNLFDNSTSSESIINLSVLNCVIEGLKQGGIYVRDNSLTGYSNYITVMSIKNSYFEGNTNDHIFTDAAIQQFMIEQCSFADVNTANGMHFKTGHGMTDKGLILMNNVSSGSNWSGEWIYFDGTSKRFAIFSGNVTDSTVFKDYVYELGVTQQNTVKVTKAGSTGSVSANEWKDLMIPSISAISTDSPFLFQIWDSADSTHLASAIYWFGDRTAKADLVTNQGITLGAFNGQGTVTFSGVTGDAIIRITRLCEPGMF